MTHHLLNIRRTVSSSLRKDKRGDAPRMIVALPRAVPIPLPLIAFGPTRLNLRRARMTISPQSSDGILLTSARSVACRGQ